TSKPSDKDNIQSISGEWLIENVSGTKVTPSEMQDTAFIGFDVANGSVYGNAGCNRIMGSFNKDAKPGELVLENTGATRMMCPDMSVEDLVLPALGEVKSYKFDNGTLLLLNSNGDVVFTLEKR
ncbi:MAG: META domain-containing protein, partial [Muribaculaceae bacterium]|nr:META domain-containing protein [Muribaculaceae bacterium]